MSWAKRGLELQFFCSHVFWHQATGLIAFLSTFSFAPCTIQNIFVLIQTKKCSPSGTAPWGLRSRCWWLAVVDEGEWSQAAGNCLGTASKWAEEAMRGSKNRRGFQHLEYNKWIATQQTKYYRKKESDSVAKMRSNESGTAWQRCVNIFQTPLVSWGKIPHGFLLPCPLLLPNSFLACLLHPIFFLPASLPPSLFRYNT